MEVYYLKCYYQKKNKNDTANIQLNKTYKQLLNKFEKNNSIGFNTIIQRLKASPNVGVVFRDLNCSLMAIYMLSGSSETHIQSQCLVEMTGAINLELKEFEKEMNEVI